MNPNDVVIAGFDRWQTLEAVRVRVAAGGPAATWQEMQLALEQARVELGEKGDAIQLAERALALLGAKP